eukprot:m.176568 g.176568  ORF g.176568 m.176568 type:complete len:75 (-) comp14628_c1_seq7:209-433(-)
MVSEYLNAIEKLTSSNLSTQLHANDAYTVMNSKGWSGMDLLSSAFNNDFLDQGAITTDVLGTQYLLFTHCDVCV